MVIHMSPFETNMDMRDLLFPSFKISLSESIIMPKLPSNNLWELFDIKSDYSLNNQLKLLLDGMDILNKEKYKNISFDDSKGLIFIHDDAQISDYCLIEGPCYIGSNAHIGHSSYVRPNSWICNDSTVGHASEIKNSLLMPNAKIPHFNYVGDSILGHDVNLGAGVKIANLRNDRKNILIKYGDTITDTKINKFGSLIGEGAKLGCNSVSNPGCIIYPNVSFPPNSNISGLNKGDYIDESR